ncbi:MAG TPA: DUF4168 domain-containing protein [Paenalcaligenes sp.]|nr:DUF4168 domain-containing protein [Paenalcaligenes sp.]
MPFSIKRLSTAVLFAVTLGTASALSYAQPTPPAAPAAPEVVQPTDEELERYIGAAQKVAAVAQEYQPQLEQASDDAARQQIMQEADEKMVAAVEEDGLSVEEYNGISLAIQQDTELRNKVEQMLNQ